MTVYCTQLTTAVHDTHTHTHTLTYTPTHTHTGDKVPATVVQQETEGGKRRRRADTIRS